MFSADWKKAENEFLDDSAPEKLVYMRSKRKRKCTRAIQKAQNRTRSFWNPLTCKVKLVRLFKRCFYILDFFFYDLHLVDPDSFNIQNDQTWENGLEWNEFRDVKKLERLTTTSTPIRIIFSGIKEWDTRSIVNMSSSIHQVKKNVKEDLILITCNQFFYLC